MVHLPYSASLQILLVTIQNAPAANGVPRGQRVKILEQAIDLLSNELAIDRGRGQRQLCAFY